MTSIDPHLKDASSLDLISLRASPLSVEVHSSASEKFLEKYAGDESSDKESNNDSGPDE